MGVGERNTDMCSSWSYLKHLLDLGTFAVGLYFVCSDSKLLSVQDSEDNVKKLRYCIMMSLSVS